MLIVHMLHCTDVGITAMPHYSGVITGTCGWSADASHLTAPRVPVGGRVIRVIGNSGGRGPEPATSSGQGRHKPAAMFAGHPASSCCWIRSSESERYLWWPPAE